MYEFSSVPRRCHVPAAVCSWQVKAFRLLLHSCQCWLIIISFSTGYIQYYHGFFQIPGGPGKEHCVKLSFAVLQMIKQLQQRMAELKKTLQKELVRVVVFSLFRWHLLAGTCTVIPKAWLLTPFHPSAMLYPSKNKKIYFRKITRGFKIVIFALMLKIILKKDQVSDRRKWPRGIFHHGASSMLVWVTYT